MKKAWKYASKAGVWKEDDQTLTVKCYEPQDELDIPGFGVRRTTTKLPVTVGLNGKNNLLPLSKKSTVKLRAETYFYHSNSWLHFLDELSENRQETTEDPAVDCQWTGYGDWSPCTASCNTGTQTRSRKVAQIARNGGRRCSGSPFDTRSCNRQRCPVPTTSTTTTTRFVLTFFHNR